MPIPISILTEKLEEKMASGETGKVEGEQSNEVAKKSKSTKKKDKKKEKKKAAVVNPSLPREPEPEIDDSDDSEFWVPPVGSRWDDDDGKDRWESSPGKDDIAEDEGASGKCHFFLSCVTALLSKAQMFISII